MSLSRMLRLLTNFSSVQRSTYVGLSSNSLNMICSSKIISKKDDVRLELKSVNDTYATLSINGEEYKYDWLFLRDSCECPQCVHQSTRQKLHCTTDIPLSISPEQNGVKILNKNSLEIIWNQSLLNQKSIRLHRSVYSSSWLQSYSTPERIARYRYHDRPIIYWTAEDLQRVNIRINCNDYLHSDECLYTALKHLNDYGLVFIDNVEGEFKIESLVERIGDIRHTFYGKTWNVRNMQQAINVAYTSEALGPHMDLLYFEAPPGLQYLHTLENDVRGGESYYVDAFRAAEIIRQNDPEAFQLLCSYPVTFHYRNIDRHYHFNRSTVVLNKFSSDDSIDHMNYAPPFQGPFETDTSKPEFRKFIRAFQYLRDLIEDPANQYELLLEKGQCVIFHNRRVLHARRAFDPTSGNRWLKGAYTDLDNFKDRLRIFREKFDDNSNVAV